jgi:hypothetical protein
VDDVKETISQYIDDEVVNTKHNQKLIDVIIKCITYTIPTKFENKNFHDKTIIPMGFSTSPIISNISFRKIDILIQKLCVKLNITYTRYADDMLFSSPRNKK